MQRRYWTLSAGTEKGDGGGKKEAGGGYKELVKVEAKERGNGNVVALLALAVWLLGDCGLPRLWQSPLTLFLNNHRTHRHIPLDDNHPSSYYCCTPHHAALPQLAPLSRRSASAPCNIGPGAVQHLPSAMHPTLHPSCLSLGKLIHVFGRETTGDQPCDASKRRAIPPSRIAPLRRRRTSNSA